MTWNSMDDAPKNATWVVLLVEWQGTTTEILAHWASDKSGEEQPAFEGWFEQMGSHGFSEIKGTIHGWRHNT